MFDKIALSQVATIASGKRPLVVQKEPSKGCNIPIVGGGGVSGFTTESLHAPGVLVTGRVGTLGKLFSLSMPCWPSDNALVLWPNSDGTDPRFLKYALQLRIADAAGMNRGAANPLLTQKDLGTLLIANPDLGSQRQIASVLSTLDDKIELNRRINETLEEMARAIFRDWFVDFGPVRRKLAGATEPIEVMGELTSDPARAAELAGLFPGKFDGELPTDWTRKTFGQLLLSSVGGDWGSDAPDAKNDQPVCIVRGTDFQDLKLGGKGKVPTRFTSLNKLGSRVLEPGDIVLEVSGGSPTQPTGRSLRITRDILDRFPHPVVCATFCRRLKPLSEADGLLAFTHLRDLYALGGTWEYQNQSTGIANFQTTHFLKTEQIVWPGTAVAEAFADLLSPMALLGTNNEVTVLEELRDYLLPRLMSGEVRVGDAALEIAA